MSKKKKEIVDDELELLTPEIEERMFEDSMKILIEDETEFFEKVRNKPINDMISDLKRTIHILMSLMKDIDPEAYDIHALQKCDYYEGVVNLKEEIDEEYKQAYIKDLFDFVENISIVKMHLVKYKHLKKEVK